MDREAWWAPVHGVEKSWIEHTPQPPMLHCRALRPLNLGCPSREKALLWTLLLPPKPWDCGGLGDVSVAPWQGDRVVDVSPRWVSISSLPEMDGGEQLGSSCAHKRSTDRMVKGLRTEFVCSKKHTVWPSGPSTKATGSWKLSWLDDWSWSREALKSTKKI